MQLLFLIFFAQSITVDSMYLPMHESKRSLSWLNKMIVNVADDISKYNLEGHGENCQSIECFEKTLLANM